MPYIYYEATDALDELSDKDLVEEMERRRKRGGSELGMDVDDGLGNGDKSAEALADETIAAFRGKQMPDCLRALLRRLSSRVF